MAGNNMGGSVEKQIEELKKRVEELEKENEAFTTLVLKREQIAKKSDEVRREWFREANIQYFTPKRIVRKAINDVSTAVVMGKKISLDKIIQKIEKKVSPDAAKVLRDATDEKEFVQRLRTIEFGITKAYKEDRDLAERLDVAAKGRRLGLYYQGKVIAELERRGKWKPMTFEELKEEIEKHKDVLEGGA